MSDQIQRHSLTLRDGTRVRYSMVIAGKQHGESNPILLCMHPGWNGEIPTPYYGEAFLTGLFLPAFNSTGAILVAPDCPAPAWNHPQTLNAILQLIRNLYEDPQNASRKVVLVGYSAGGWGAWYLLRQSSLEVSAVVLLATLPIIDAVAHYWENFDQLDDVLSNRREEWLRGLPDIPFFLLHSRADELFPIDSAEETYRVLVDGGKQAMFRSVDGAGHFEASGYVRGLQEAARWLETL